MTDPEKGPPVEDREEERTPPESPETEHVEDEGEPLGANFA